MAPECSKKMRVTVPRPFNLLTQARGMEKEERFRAAIAECEQKAAKRRIPKANPLPMTTFDPQVPAKPEPQHPTVARPFHLEGTERHAAALAHVKELRAAAEQADISLPFHASPVPRSLAVPQEPAKPEPQPPTVLRPFHLEGSERHAAAVEHLRELREAAEQADITRPFNASPVPHSLAVPQVPSKPAPKPSTVPKEFNLEGVVRHKEDLELLARARAMVAKEIGKEREFKAQPILDYSDAALPQKTPGPVTVPQEVVLETAKRGRKSVETEEEAPPKRRAPPSQSPGLRRCAFSIVAERRCGHEYGLLSGFGEGQPLLVLSA